MQLLLASGGSGGKALPSSSGSAMPVLNPSGAATPWVLTDVKHGHEGQGHGGGAAVALTRHQLGKATVPNRRASFMENMATQPKPCNRPPPLLSLALTNLRGREAPPALATTTAAAKALEAGAATSGAITGAAQASIFREGAAAAPAVHGPTAPT